MFSRTKLCTALFVAMSANAWAQGAAPAAAPAPEATQRVEITGSAIRRVETEGALPVTVISREAAILHERRIADCLASQAGPLAQLFASMAASHAVTAADWRTTR